MGREGGKTPHAGGAATHWGFIQRSTRRVSFHSQLRVDPERRRRGGWRGPGGSAWAGALGLGDTGVMSRLRDMGLMSRLGDTGLMSWLRDTGLISCLGDTGLLSRLQGPMDSVQPNQPCGAGGAEAGSAEQGPSCCQSPMGTPAVSPPNLL